MTRIGTSWTMRAKTTGAGAALLAAAAALPA